MISGQPNQVIRDKGVDSPGALVVIAIWFALLSGLIEVLVLTIQHHTISPLLRISRNYGWMAPVALTLCALALFGACYMLSLIWRSPDWWRITTFACASLAFFNLLLLIPGLHHYAALLLAVGLGVQTMSFLSKRRPAFSVLAHRTVPWLIGLVVVLGVTVKGRQVFAERRALAALPKTPISSPNVLLITLDTVRARNLSLYGYHRSTTPQLERFAKKGVVFDRAVSTAPWTLTSHASMFTGRSPHELSADWTVPLDGAFPTLAEVLSAKGYVTAGFVANTGYCSYETGLDRGFARYEDFRISLSQIIDSSTLTRTVADNWRLRRLMKSDEHLNRQSADLITGDFLSWLSKAPPGPFFVFLNYYDAHGPYLPPPPYDTMFGPGRRNGKLSPLKRWNWYPAAAHGNMGEAEIQEELDAYDGALAYLDDQLGILFDELQRRDVLDNTLVIITSDHGEEFGEHGVFGHGHSLYFPSVHVPLLISFPNRLPTEMRVRDLVTLSDLPATVMDLLGFGEGSPFPGASLSRYWRSERGPSILVSSALLSEVNYAAGHPNSFPVSKGDMKSLIYKGMRYIKNGDGSEELYDLEKDPGEKQNLNQGDARQTELEEFRERLATLLSSSSTP